MIALLWLAQETVKLKGTIQVLLSTCTPCAEVIIAAMEDTFVLVSDEAASPCTVPFSLGG